MTTKKQEQQLFIEIKDDNGDKEKVLKDLKDLVFTIDYCKNVYFWNVNTEKWRRERTFAKYSKCVILKLKSGGSLVLETKMEQSRYITFTREFVLVESNLNIETINMKTIKALIIKLEREIYDKNILKIDKEIVEDISKNTVFCVELILENVLKIANYKIVVDVKEQMLIVKYKGRYDCYIYLYDLMTDSKKYLNMLMTDGVDTNSEIYIQLINWYSKINSRFKVD